MATNSNEQGGIHARRIEADNVVSGTQIQGGDMQSAAALVQLAQAIQRGDISADEIYDFTCLALDKIQIIRKMITIK